MRRLLITGAAGGLGTILREGLSGWAEFLRLNDIAEMPAAGPNEASPSLRPTFKSANSQEQARINVGAVLGAIDG